MSEQDLNNFENSNGEVKEQPDIDAGNGKKKKVGFGLNAKGGSDKNHRKKSAQADDADDDSDDFYEETPEAHKVSDLIRESYIVGILKIAIEYLMHLFHSGGVFAFFTDNTKLKNYFKSSWLVCTCKNALSSSIRLQVSREMNEYSSQSYFLSDRREFGKGLLRTPVYSFGIVLLSLGITSTLIYFVDLWQGNHIDIHPSQPFIGVLIILIALLSFMLRGTVAEAVKSGNFSRMVLFTSFGATVKLDDETPCAPSKSALAVLGIGLGLLSVFIPLYAVIIVLALCVALAIILKSPETGVLLVIFAVLFLPSRLMVLGTVMVWFSFAFKYFTGKRVIRFEYVDLLPFVFWVALVVGNLLSLGNGTKVNWDPIVISSLYFLIVVLIRDYMWASRCRVMLTICGISVAILSILRNVFNNPLGIGMEMIDALELGGIYDSVADNSAVASFMLAMIFFVELAVFYSRKKASEKFGIFVICVLIAVAFFTVSGIRASVIFVLLTILALINIAKGLRWSVLVAAVFILVMPLFGLPSASSLLASFGGEVMERFAVWNEFYSMLTTDGVLGYKIALAGIGIRPEALGELYLGLGVSTPNNLALQIAVTLGIPMLAVFYAMIFSVLKYCRSYGRRSSDKLTESRVHGYGSAFSVMFAVLLGFSENIWFNQRSTAMFWLILGLTVAVQRYASNDAVRDYMSELIPEI